MAKEPDSDDSNLSSDDNAPLEETTLDTEFDLLTNQTGVLSSHILSDGEIQIDKQQLEFVQFLRSIKSEDQKLSLADLYTDFELILLLQNNIDMQDDNDPIGQPTLENSAKKTLLLLGAVTRILNNILRVKPEAHYIKETYRLRKNTHLPVDEYYSVKSPELDLVKAYTNFDQLKLLLVNSMHNRQAFDLLDTLYDRVLPQFKEYLKRLRRGEPHADSELLDSRPDSGETRVNLQA